MATFAILRTAKLKSAGAIRGAAGHNERSRSTPNADPAGQVVCLVDSGPDAYASVLNKIENTGAKYRSNSVLCQEILLSVSPEFFDADGNLESWLNETKKWLKEEFGDRIIGCHLHLDEATPHIHALAVPLTKDGRLSARDVFSKQALREMQTSYAKALEELGVERGIEKSKAKHTKIQEFYAAVNTELPDQPKVSVPPIMKREQWAASENAKLKDTFDVLSQKANALEMAQQRSYELQDTLVEKQNKISEVREIPLSLVLQKFGLKIDPRDKNQWKGRGMRITLDGSKWYDHNYSKGAGGAIDLAMHITGSDFKGAVAWLGAEISALDAKAGVLYDSQQKASQEADKALISPNKSAVPISVPENLPTVVEYLTEIRKIEKPMVDWLIGKKLLYADKFSNCVFNYDIEDTHCAAGKGVEIRGTGEQAFKGFRGEKSMFKLGSGDIKKIVLVESAIDAISYRQLHKNTEGLYVYSMAGGFKQSIAEAFIQASLDRETSLVAAFDDDRQGNAYTKELSALAALKGFEIEREVPISKDWNEDLVKKSEPAVHFDQSLDFDEPMIAPH